MGQYISKSALVAEIEKRKNMFYDMSKGCEDASSAKAGFYAQAQTLEGILSFINTLEVKEVDLEKEIDLEEDKYYGFDSLSRADIINIAKHFFELGLKAQKGEQL